MTDVARTPWRLTITTTAGTITINLDHEHTAHTQYRLAMQAPGALSAVLDRHNGTTYERVHPDGRANQLLTHLEDLGWTPPPDPTAAPPLQGPGHSAAHRQAAMAHVREILNARKAGR